MEKSTKKEKQFTITVNHWYISKLGEKSVKEEVLPKLYEQANSYFEYGWNLISLDLDFDDEKKNYLFSIHCQSKVNEEEEEE